MQSDRNHQALNPQDALPLVYDFAASHPWEELVEKAKDTYDLVDFSSLDAAHPVDITEVRRRYLDRRLTVASTQALLFLFFITIFQ